VHDNELALKNALLTRFAPNVYLGRIAMLTRSPLNVAQTMSRIDNHAIIVACLDDRRVAPEGFLRQSGLRM
jgi:DNA-binding LytR/AlgR family response regulator